MALANSKPQRIISMSPSITEILFAIGAKKQIVGVTQFCNYPESAKSISRIGGLLNPSKEQIITLKPDLIIFHYDSQKFSNFAKQLDIHTITVSFNNLKDIFDSIEKIGQATGNLAGARKTVKIMREQIEGYRKTLKTLKPKSTLLILGDSPDPMRDLYAVGEGSFLDELLVIAGGINIIRNPPTLYPKVSREYIISESPEVILVVGPSTNINEAKFSADKGEWLKLSSVKAVQNQRVHYIGSNFILIPGPRLTSIIEQFAKAIHPEAFANETVTQKIIP